MRDELNSLHERLHSSVTVEERAAYLRVRDETRDEASRLGTVAAARTTVVTPGDDGDVGADSPGCDLHAADGPAFFEPL